MFWIGFTDEPLIAAEPGEQGGVGLLVLGSHEERFVSHMWTWSEQQYVDHWKHALIRASEGKPSALVTDMRTPVQSSHLVWWPMWRINSEVVFQNQLLFFAQIQVEGSHVDIERLYRLIGEHSSHDHEGVALSEWSVPVSDIERFVNEGWRTPPFSVNRD